MKVDFKFTIGGLGLSVLFAVLKLANIIDWPWIWVFCPFWISLILAVVCLIITVCLAVNVGHNEKKFEKEWAEQSAEHSKRIAEETARREKERALEKKNAFNKKVPVSKEVDAWLRNPDKYKDTLLFSLRQQSTAYAKSLVPKYADPYYQRPVIAAVKIAWFCVMRKHLQTAQENPEKPICLPIDKEVLMELDVIMKSGIPKGYSDVFTTVIDECRQIFEEMGYSTEQIKKTFMAARSKVMARYTETHTAATQPIQHDHLQKNKR